MADPSTTCVFTAPSIQKSDLKRSVMKRVEHLILDGVRHIGPKTFEKLNLQSVRFVGCTHVTIGSDAFAHCKRLRSVEWPESVDIDEHAFQGCGFEHLVYPNIRDEYGGWHRPHRFSDCNQLRSIKFPAYVTRICTDFELFNHVGAERHSKVKLLGGFNVACIEMRAFSGVPIDCDLSRFINLKVIEDNAFSECSMKTLRLPESVEIVGSDCFSGNDFETVHWPLNRMSCGVLSDCTKLRHVEAPILEYVGTSALEGCALETLPRSDRTMVVHNSAFAHNNFVSLDLTNGAIEVQQHSHTTFSNCKDLVHVTIAGIHMATSMFQGCSRLETVVVHPSVSYLEAEMFAQCWSLRSVTSKQKLEIRHAAFSGCSALESLEGSVPNVVVAPKRRRVRSGPSALSAWVQPDKNTWASHATTVGEDVFVRSTFRMLNLVSAEGIYSNAFRFSQLVYLHFGPDLKVMHPGAFDGASCLRVVSFDTVPIITPFARPQAEGVSLHTVIVRSPRCHDGDQGISFSLWLDMFPTIRRYLGPVQFSPQNAIPSIPCNPYSTSSALRSILLQCYMSPVTCAADKNLHAAATMMCLAMGRRFPRVPPEIARIIMTMLPTTPMLAHT